MRVGTGGAGENHFFASVNGDEERRERREKFALRLAM